MKILVITMLLTALSFVSTAQSKESSLDEARKAIEASNAIYSDLAMKDDDSILTRYTADACLLPPNSPLLCGREGVLSFFKNGPKLHAKFTIISVFGDAIEYVTEISRYELFDLNWKKVDEGKIEVLWKKTKDGWKMHRDMFSSNWPQSK